MSGARHTIQAQRHGLRLLGVVVLSLEIASFGRAAHAFECIRVGLTSGPSVTWQTRELRYLLDAALTPDIADRATAERAILGGLGVWTDASCSDVQFLVDGQRDGLVAGWNRASPNSNVIVFVSSGWRHDPHLLAATTPVFDSRSGAMLDADIEINDEHFTFVDARAACNTGANEMDLQNMIAHEAGHALGFDHPPHTAENAEATMHRSSEPCETKKRDLAADDIHAVCTTYPANAPTQPCFLANEEPPDTPRESSCGCRSSGAPSSAPYAMNVVFAAGALAIAFFRFAR